MIGLMLGMAAANRGTMDSTTNRMLFLHLPSRHPANFPELELSSNVQAAALLGVGLLYQVCSCPCSPLPDFWGSATFASPGPPDHLVEASQGSCHRLVVEILLQEIGRRPGQGGNLQASATTGATNHDREGYALAAGLALGLIMLGKGREATGLTGASEVPFLGLFCLSAVMPKYLRT